MLNSEEVKMILPQKGVAAVVDKVIGHSSNFTESEFTICDDSFYFKDSNSSHAGIIENMAQTFLLGQYISVKQKPEDSLFLLAAVNYLNVYKNLNENEVINTKTKLIKSAMGIFKVQGKTYLRNALIAEAEFIVKEVRHV